MRSIKLPSWIERLLGLDPLAVPPHVFVVEPGGVAYGQFAKSARGRGSRSGSGFDFRAFGSVELPANCFQPGLMGGPPRDPAILDQALGALVERLGIEIKQASLVLPDAWFRVAFSEVGDLPKGKAERDEVLRWKLKRLVPFQVEEIRVTAAEVSPLVGQTEPRRLLLGFALETLLAQLEDSFARAGIAIGQITNTSLAVFDAVRPWSEKGHGPAAAAGLSALVLVAEDGYTLLFARGDEPILHRFKGAAGGAGSAFNGSLVGRDLKLTRQFVEEHFFGEPLSEVLLAAPSDLEPFWLDQLEESLGAPVVVLDRAHLPPLELFDRSSGVESSLPPWKELASMIGAARGEAR